jgi:hypothetical protein
MDPIVARKTWRTLEPYHGLVYFAPEATERYAALGVEGRDGYFASRSAPMGPVTADVVVATFFNFRPSIVHHALPAAWTRTTPVAMLAARLDAIDHALRRLLGDALDQPAIAAAAVATRRAAEACGSPAGRPLYAGHASLPWPDAPHLALWHAISVLREFRGDGHVACLVDAGIDGCEALVLHAATGDVPRALLRATRAWTDDEWSAAVDRLASRGLVDADGSFTAAGRDERQRIEDRTDALALAPWAALGESTCEELRTTIRPLSRAIVEGGGIAPR